MSAPRPGCPSRSTRRERLRGRFVVRAIPWSDLTHSRSAAPVAPRRVTHSVRGILGQAVRGADLVRSAIGYSACVAQVLSVLPQASAGSPATPAGLKPRPTSTAPSSSYRGAWSEHLAYDLIRQTALLSCS